MIQDQIEEIEQSLEKPDSRAVKLAGILLTVEHDGRVEIMRGLIRAEDKKALKALVKSPEGQRRVRTRSRPMGATPAPVYPGRCA